MIIGLCGAHRTGKSTLATQFASHSNSAFISVSISNMQKKYGYSSANQNYSWETRKHIQMCLFGEFEDLLKQIPKGNTVILDRTPLDLIGYLLIHVNENIPNSNHEFIQEYIRECIKLTNRYFNRVVLVQPGIPLVNENETSAMAHGPVIELLNSIYRGYFSADTLSIPFKVIPRDLINLQSRIDFIY